MVLSTVFFHGFIDGFPHGFVNQAVHRSRAFQPRVHACFGQEWEHSQTPQDLSHLQGPRRSIASTCFCSIVLAHSRCAAHRKQRFFFALVRKGSTVVLSTKSWPRRFCPWDLVTTPPPPRQLILTSPAIGCGFCSRFCLLAARDALAHPPKKKTFNQRSGTMDKAWMFFFSRFYRRGSIKP